MANELGFIRYANNPCFLVIVDKALRGCGLGRVVMESTEDFAQKYG